jgi:hypothetical protein
VQAKAAMQEAPARAAIARANMARAATDLERTIVPVAALVAVRRAALSDSHSPRALSGNSAHRDRWPAKVAQAFQVGGTHKLMLRMDDEVSRIVAPALALANPPPLGHGGSLQRGASCAN